MYDNYMNDNSDFIYNKIKSVFDNFINVFSIDVIYFLILFYFIYIIIVPKKKN